MKESTFWSSKLRPLLVKTAQTANIRVHFERVENAVAVGTPDVNYCVTGVTGSIELKYTAALPKREDTPVLGRGNGMRKSQIVWAYRRLRAGGLVFLCIGAGSKVWLLDLRNYHTAQAMKDIETKPDYMLSQEAAWTTGESPTDLFFVLRDLV